jgi:hypothetical protein
MTLSRALLEIADCDLDNIKLTLFINNVNSMSFIASIALI